MKKKLLLGLVLASVASANSFAMNIVHGKLISHKEWTKGNIHASFKEIQNKAVALTALKSKGDGMVDFVSASSSAYPYVGEGATVNQDVNIWGESTVYITNNSSEQKTYVITTALDIAPPCQSRLCPIVATAFSEDTVTLDPNGGTVEFRRNPNVTMNFSSAGNAWYMVNTSVQVDGGTVFYSPSGSQEFTVSDAQK